MKKLSVLFVCILAITSCSKDVVLEEIVLENTIESPDVSSRPGDEVPGYVIIATEKVELKEENSLSGNVGVTDSEGEIKLKDNSYVNGTVTAYEVDIDDDSGAETVSEVPDDVEIPPFYDNTLSNGASPDVKVEDCTVVLDGDVYKKVEIKDDACVTFTSVNISIEELKIGKNTTINFTQCAELLINKKVEFGENTNFNPAMINVSLFVNDNVKVEKGSNIAAYIHANDNDIEAKGDDDQQITMTGQFIGKKVKGENNVTWVGNTNLEEIVYNGIDDDCNPATLDDDLDQDGFNNDVDCDDTNADVKPDAEEICDNGIDDNCDGQIDEGCVRECITDADIRTAVNLWVSNQTAAEATYGHISNWNTSCVTNMQGLFYNKGAFNDDISSWDVSNVTNMSSMFGFAFAFNQDLGDWDVSSVTDMFSMFRNTEFNGDISGWDVSSVTNMRSMFMFAGAPGSINQDLSDWDVSSVTDMSSMFRNTRFNGDISGWNVISVTNMSGMFSYQGSINQDLSGWNVSNVTNMSGMFRNTLFNQDLSGWNVISVTICGGFSVNANSWTAPKPNFTNCTP